MNCLNRSHKFTTLTSLGILMCLSLRAQVDPSIPLRVTPPQSPNLTDTVIKLQQLKLQQQAEEQERSGLRQRQSSDAVHLTMKQMMLPNTYVAAGLQKLSPEELAALDAWLTRYTFNLKRILQAQLSPASGEVISAKIDGDFEGWSGETIFKLDNGQIWQQSSYAYTYHYAYRPDVLIFQSEGAYKMKVADVTDAIEVKRIK